MHLFQTIVEMKECLKNNFGAHTNDTIYDLTLKLVQPKYKNTYYLKPQETTFRMKLLTNNLPLNARYNNVEQCNRCNQQTAENTKHFFECQDNQKILPLMQETLFEKIVNLKCMSQHKIFTTAILQKLNFTDRNILKTTTGKGIIQEEHVRHIKETTKTNTETAKLIIFNIMDQWLSIIYHQLWKRRNLIEGKRRHQNRHQAPPDPPRQRPRKQNRPKITPFRETTNAIHKFIIENPNNRINDVTGIIFQPPPKRKRKENDDDRQTKKLRAG